MAASFDPAATPPAPSVDADSIVNRSFSNSFRGWDPDEVRVHLVAVGESVRSLLQYQGELTRRLDEANAAARRANTAELDEAEVAAILGEETARILSAAREAAAEMQAKAAERVAEMLREAESSASSVRARADSEAHEARRRANEEAAATRAAGEEHVAGWRANAEAELAALREKMESELAVQRQAAREEDALVRAEGDEAAARVRGEADEAAERVREQADAYQAKVRTDADVYAERIRAEADAEVERRQAEVAAECQTLLDEATSTAAAARVAAESELAEARARSTTMVAEAQLVRDRVLADLAKRRKAARQHLEQLRAARDRLLSAYDVVKGTVDEATRELTVVLPEAKLAADEAARRVAAEPEPTIEQLEAEVAMARDAGLPIIEDDEVLALVDDAVDEADAGDEADADAVAVAVAVAVADAVAEVDAVDDAVDEAVAVDEADAARAEAVEGAGAPAVAPVPPVEAVPPPTSVDLRALREKERRHKGLRRRRDSLADELQGGPLPAVEVSAEFEVVRVIETGEVPVVEVGSEAEPATPSAGGSAGEPATLATREAAGPSRAERAAPAQVPSEPAAADPSAAGAAAEAVGDDAKEAPDVDALFARLRAERAPAADEPAGSSEPAEQAKAGPTEKAEPGTSSEQATPADTTVKAARAKAEPAEPAEPAEKAKPTEAAQPKAAAKAEPAAPAGIDPEAAAAASLLEKRDGQLADIEQRLAKRLKRVLSDDQSALLDELRRARKHPVAADVLPAAEAQLDAYATAAHDDLRSAVVAGARFAGDLDDRAASGSRLDPSAIARRLAESFAGPLRARIERALSDDPSADDEAGADPTVELELADRIRACYREWRSQRLGDVVADAVLAAFSEGLFDALPDAGELRWLVDQGDSPCADCGDNALAGAVAKGSDFPTGHRLPPAHVGCRCIVLPAAMVTDAGVRVPRGGGSVAGARRG